VKEGETTNDLFAFLTTDANNVVGAIHPKAMPVILTKPEELDAWMAAPPEEALMQVRQSTREARSLIMTWIYALLFYFVVAAYLWSKLNG
jgi:putative SOS response-associated peptidase YedK